MNNCSTCIHNKVCRFKKIYETKCKRIDDCLGITTDEKEGFEIGQFTVEIKCKDFELDVPKPREIDTDKLIGTGEGLKVLGTPNPCIDCDWYKTYYLGGKLYIGDAPCQWCDKNPHRATWSDTTAIDGCHCKKEGE